MMIQENRQRLKKSNTILIECQGLPQQTLLLDMYHMVHIKAAAEVADASKETKAVQVISKIEGLKLHLRIRSNLQFNLQYNEGKKA